LLKPVVPKNSTCLLIKYGNKLYITWNSQLRNIQKHNPEASKKQTSPTLLIIKAFKLALLASTLVFQNPINRYEQIPTPYHPINITIKLSELTRTSIKNVNKDK